MGERPVGQPDSAPVGAESEPLMPVRVTREVQTVEVMGTPEQIARSGLTHPGGDGMAHNIDGTGGWPAGQGGLVMGAFTILAAFEAWAVFFLHKLCLAGATHPRLVLWLGVLLALMAVTS